MRCLTTSGTPLPLTKLISSSIHSLHRLERHVGRFFPLKSERRDTCFAPRCCVRRCLIVRRPTVRSPPLAIGAKCFNQIKSNQIKSGQPNAHLRPLLVRGRRGPIIPPMNARGICYDVVVVGAVTPDVGIMHPALAGPTGAVIVRVTLGDPSLHSLEIDFPCPLHRRQELLLGGSAEAASSRE